MSAMGLSTHGHYAYMRTTLTTHGHYASMQTTLMCVPGCVMFPTTHQHRCVQAEFSLFVMSAGLHVATKNISIRRRDTQRLHKVKTHNALHQSYCLRTPIGIPSRGWHRHLPACIASDSPTASWHKYEGIIMKGCQTHRQHR